VTCSIGPGSRSLHDYIRQQLPGTWLLASLFAHNLVASAPPLGWLRKFGTVAANHENALMALESGAALLVYPGGDYEVFRPS